MYHHDIMNELIRKILIINTNYDLVSKDDSELPSFARPTSASSAKKKLLKSPSKVIVLTLEVHLIRRCKRGRQYQMMMIQC